MAEKKIIDLEIKDNVQSVKKQFAEAKKELLDMAAAYGENSVQALQAAKRAGDLKDIIDDSAEAIKNLQGGGAFKALSTSLTTVASGFSAVEGAVNLLGVESKDVEQALLKVQSAMALAEGLRGLEDANRAFGALKGVVVGAFQSMSTAGKAFAVTGIGLIITGIALAIANVDKLKAMFSGLSQAQKISNEIANKSVEIAAKELSALDKLKGVINDEALTRREKNKAVKDLQSEYPDLLKYMDSEKMSLEEINNAISLNVRLVEAQAKMQAIAELRAEEYKKQLQAQVDAQTGANIGVDDAIEGIWEQFKATGSLSYSNATLSKVIKAANADTKEQIKASQGIISILDDQAFGIQKIITATQDELGLSYEAEEARKKADEAKRKAEEKAKQAIQDRINKLAELRKFEQGIYDNRLSEYDKEVLDLQRKYDEMYKIAKKYNQDVSILDEGKFEDQKALDKKYNDDITANAAEMNKAHEQSTGLVIKDYQKEYQEQLDQSKKKKEIDDAETKRKKDKRDQEIQIAEYGLSTISSLTELFAGKSLSAQKKAFQVQKAAQIAQATIDTYKSATGAFSAFSSIPIVGPALGFIAAGAAVAAGLANVKKIASTKFDGGTSGGGVGGGSASFSGGSSGAVGASTVSQTAAPVFNITGNQQQQQNLAPVQAFVVGSNVTTQQELDRKRIDTSTF